MGFESIYGDIDLAYLGLRFLLGRKWGGDLRKGDF